MNSIDAEIADLLDIRPESISNRDILKGLIDRVEKAIKTNPVNLALKTKKEALEERLNDLDHEDEQSDRRTGW